MIDESTVVTASDSLTTADLDTEKVVLDLKSGHYFGLNEVGGRILELTQQPRSVASIIETLHDEFDVDKGRLRDDVIRFIRALTEHRMTSVQERAA